MSDGLKILLGALDGAIVALLLAGGFSGSGMGYGMMVGGMGQMMGLHDGRRPLWHAVRRAVLAPAPCLAGHGGGVDLQPGPAQIDIRTLT
jgi:hypothetical protein